MLVLLSAVVALTLPQQGIFAPNRSLGGVHLGDTRATVVARWGTDFGVCRDCRSPTLYWNYKPFEPQGAGVTLRRGHVVAVFTLWSPPGWRTTKGVAVGESSTRLTQVYGPLVQTTCVGYVALTLSMKGVVSAFYVSGELVYGFGLMRPYVPVCR